MENIAATKNPNDLSDKIKFLEFLPQTFEDLKTPLRTIFSFSELLKFEIERKKKLISSQQNSSNHHEFNDYAEYAREISDAVFEMNKVLETLLKNNPASKNFNSH